MTMYVVKVKGTSRTLDVDSDKISDELCAYIFQKGLDSIMGRGRTNLAKKEDFKSEKEFEAAAVEIAEKQLADLYENKTRRVGGGAKKVTKAEQAVRTEMVRLAKIDFNEMLKANGFKVTKVSAASKKEGAEALIAQDSEKYRKAAEANLAAAHASVATVKGLDLSFVKEDEKKVAKAAKAKAEKAAAKAAKDAEVAKGSSPPPTATRSKPSPVRPLRQ